MKKEEQNSRILMENWVGKIPWRRKWQPTPVLLPGKSHGQKSLIGYSPWGRKESDTTEWLHSLSGELEHPRCENTFYIIEHSDSPRSFHHKKLKSHGDWPLHILPINAKLWGLLLSLAQSCPTLCHTMDWSNPGFPVLHYLLEFSQTHGHWVGDVIQLSHPLSSPSPPVYTQISPGCLNCFYS